MKPSQLSVEQLVLAHLEALGFSMRASISIARRATIVVCNRGRFKDQERDADDAMSNAKQVDRPDVPLTAEEVAALSKAASPRPWKACSASDGDCACGLVWSLPMDNTVCSVYKECPDGDMPRDMPRSANMAFIVAACNAYDGLVDEVERLKSELAAAVDRIEVQKNRFAFIAAELRRSPMDNMAYIIATVTAHDAAAVEVERLVAEVAMLKAERAVAELR